jgi:hypothetical protein
MHALEDMNGRGRSRQVTAKHKAARPVWTRFQPRQTGAGLLRGWLLEEFLPGFCSGFAQLYLELFQFGIHGIIAAQSLKLFFHTASVVQGIFEHA